MSDTNSSLSEDQKMRIKEDVRNAVNISDQRTFLKYIREQHALLNKDVDKLKWSMKRLRRASRVFKNNPKGKVRPTFKYVFHSIDTLQHHIKVMGIVLHQRIKYIKSFEEPYKTDTINALNNLKDFLTMNASKVVIAMNSSDFVKKMPAHLIGDIESVVKSQYELQSIIEEIKSIVNPVQSSWFSWWFW